MDYSIIHKDSSVADYLIPLSEICDHVRVYDPHEEALLTVYRDAAIDFAERYMNKALLPQLLSIHLPHWTPSTYLPLTSAPTVVSLTSGLFSEYQNHDLEEIRITGSRIWLSPKLRNRKDFTITYQTPNSPLAGSVKLGILKLIATWYESREDVSFGVSVTQVPFNHLACFNLHRIPAGS
ncbi:TPA: hypothetical protein PMC50_002520 [Vibrio cholerae]|nr:hypothetical protein [Vibrio cholerae]